MGVSVVHRRARDKKHAPRVNPGVPLENDFQFRYWPAMHWLPLIGFVVFVGLGVGWRSWLQRCRHGSSGIVLFRSLGWAQNVREAGAIVLVALLAVQSIALAVDPRSLDRFLVVRPTATVQWLGAVVLFTGVALMIAAQLDLGASWRIGIEEGARPGLVVDGLYRFCRNPIFLAMFTVLAGFLLLVPAWPALVVFLGTYVGIRGAIGAEEDYLRRAYGDDYVAYASRVGRFLPYLGRLAAR
jgi:protein-S-isoprenylcysteine O-methyltransferase Ste14